MLQLKQNYLKNSLELNIETTHRAAKGDLICKFVIKEKKEEYL